MLICLFQISDTRLFVEVREFNKEKQKRNQRKWEVRQMMISRWWCLLQIWVLTPVRSYRTKTLKSKTKTTGMTVRRIFPMKIFPTSSSSSSSASRVLINPVIAFYALSESTFPVSSQTHFNIYCFSSLIFVVFISFKVNFTFIKFIRKACNTREHLEVLNLSK